MVGWITPAIFLVRFHHSPLRFELCLPILPQRLLLSLLGLPRSPGLGAGTVARLSLSCEGPGHSDKREEY